jgi:ComF family protein
MNYLYQKLIRVFTGIVELLFPSVCLACGDELVPGEEFICLYCLMDMPPSNLVSQPNSNPVMDKFVGKVSLTGAASVYWFDKHTSVQALIHQLKYKQQPELGIRMGRLMGAEWKNYFPDKKTFTLVPVPLHPTRQKRRGYNQAEQLAIGIGEKTGFPLAPQALRRKVNNISQTGKSKSSRWENVKQIFECPVPPDGPVILVDDVVTTGATLEACIKTLNSKGVNDITVLSFAAARIEKG